MDTAIVWLSHYSLILVMLITSGLRYTRKGTRATPRGYGIRRTTFRVLTAHVEISCVKLDIRSTEQTMSGVVHDCIPIFY